MKTFIAFRRDRRMALRQFQALFVAPSEVNDGEIIAQAPDAWVFGSDLDALFLTSSGQALIDPGLALTTARGMAVDSIRGAARAVLEQLDIRHNARLGELRINRTDPARIEAFYTTLLEQQQVRDSSNAAQDAAMWLEGESENGAPSEEWKSLVR